MASLLKNLWNFFHIHMIAPDSFQIDQQTSYHPLGMLAFASAESENMAIIHECHANEVETLLVGMIWVQNCQNQLM